MAIASRISFRPRRPLRGVATSRPVRVRAGTKLSCTRKALRRQLRPRPLPCLANTCANWMRPRYRNAFLAAGDTLQARSKAASSSADSNTGNHGQGPGGLHADRPQLVREKRGRFPAKRPSRRVSCMLRRASVVLQISKCIDGWKQSGSAPPLGEPGLRRISAARRWRRGRPAWDNAITARSLACTMGPTSRRAGGGRAVGRSCRPFVADHPSDRRRSQGRRSRGAGRVERPGSNSPAWPPRSSAHNADRRVGWDHTTARFCRPPIDRFAARVRASVSPPGRRRARRHIRGPWHRRRGRQGAPATSRLRRSSAGSFTPPTAAAMATTIEPATAASGSFLFSIWQPVQAFGTRLIGRSSRVAAAECYDRVADRRPYTFASAYDIARCAPFAT